MKTVRSMELVPGVYRTPGGNARTLIAPPIDGVCIYAFGNAAGDSIGIGAALTGGVTTCSVKTFKNAVGDKPARVFTPVEISELVSRMVPAHPAKRSNAVQRFLFFTDLGKNTVLNALPALPVAQPAAPEPAPVTASRPVGLAAALKATLKSLAWRKGGNSTAVAATTTAAPAA